MADPLARRSGGLDRLKITDLGALKASGSVLEHGGQGDATTSSVPTAQRRCEAPARPSMLEHEFASRAHG
jgi:hypothetical protein